MRKCSLVKVRKRNISELRNMCDVVLSDARLPYSLFKNLLSNEGGNYSYLASSRNEYVGCVGCIVKENTLYMFAIAVLVLHRNKGIGSLLINRVTRKVKERNSNIEKMSLNVQTSNDIAISFYKKHGFRIVKRIEQYYRRLNPPSCFVMEKNLK